jgi:hypothetical protein
MKYPNYAIHSLQPLEVRIDITLFNEVDTPSESRAAEAAIRNEANSHPNHPEVFIMAWPSVIM